MNLRTVATCLLLSTSVAAADGTELVVATACAEIDATRDLLPADQRVVAGQQLTRALEAADQLVVQHDCTEHYVLSHEQADGDFVVRIEGPVGVRRMRNPDRTKLPAAYARMVRALLTAQEAASREARASEVRTVARPVKTAAYEAADASDPYADAPHAEDEPTAVSPERIIYGQLLAGSAGQGIGFGYRAPISSSVAFDISLKSAGSADENLFAIGAKVLRYLNPSDRSTIYVGGGLSFGMQQNDAMQGSGAQLDGVVGFAFNRTGNWRYFLQGDLMLPLYTVEGTDVASYTPAAMLSLGIGR